jgi:hypothetical protein
MDRISIHLIYRDMLLPGCFCFAWNQLLHFFAAAINRNAFIPDHGHNISAVPANQKFLFHLSSLLPKVCPNENK